MSTATLTAPELDVIGERHRRQVSATRTAQAGLAAKAVNYAVRLVSIPLALRLLGPAPYGLWLTAGSLIGWLNFADLGIGSGLVNAVAGARATHDARRLISTAFAAVAAAAVLLTVLVFALSRCDTAVHLMGAGGDLHLASDARLLLCLLGVLFAASFALSPIGNVCAALQEGYRAHIAAIGGTVVSLGLLAVLAVTGTSLLTFSIAMGAPAVIATLALGVWLFAGPHRELRPSLAAIDPRSLRTILAQGGPLFLVTLADLSVVYSTNVLIAASFGAAAVPLIAVPLAIYSVFINTCGSIIQPYWPAFVEAASRGDWSWIRSASLRTLRVTTALITFGSLGTVVLGRPFLRLWAGPGAVPDQSLLNALAVYAIAQVLSCMTGTVLMGLGCLRTRAVLHIGSALAHWVGFGLLAGKLGATALPVAGAFGYGVEAALAAVIAARFLAPRLRT